MAKKQNFFKSKGFLLLAALMLVSLVLSLTAPINQASLDKYHISVFQIRLIALSFQIPIYAIWAVAAYGFVNVKHYAKSISGDPDGKAFNTLANGLGVLAFSLPVSSLFQSAVTRITTNNLSKIPVTTTLNQYLSLAFSVTAMALICKGAYALAKLSDNKVKKTSRTVWAGLFALLGAGYAWAILANSTKRITPTATSRATYYLPDWAIVVTLLVPNLIGWFLGFSAVYYLSVFARKIQGVIYKQSLKWLGRGVGAVVVFSVLVQLLNIFGKQFANLSIGPILAIIYVLVAGIAVCYGLIAKGAKLLTKIEEV